MEEVTAVVINYNGGTLVLDAIESILNQQGVSVDVIVVDDSSTDGSFVAIQKKFPQVELYQEKDNTKEINRLRNKGLEIAETEKVLITDNDVKFDKFCIKRMVDFMQNKEDVSVCIPRLMYIDDKSKVYHEGGDVHYIGATVSQSRDSSLKGSEEKPKITAGGGIALLDKKKLRGIGFFDEGYRFGWGCDGEFHQRVLLSGQKCVCVPSAVGFHEYKEFDESRGYRAEGQIYNRWRYIITHYAFRTIVVILPALLVYEVSQAIFFLLKGMPMLYLRGTFDALRHLPEALEKREEIQSLRAVSDRELLTAGPLYVRPSEGVIGKLVSAVVTTLSLFLSGYWSLVRPLLPDKATAQEGTGGSSGKSVGVPASFSTQDN